MSPTTRLVCRSSIPNGLQGQPCVPLGIFPSRPLVFISKCLHQNCFQHSSPGMKGDGQDTNEQMTACNPCISSFCTLTAVTGTYFSPVVVMFLIAIPGMLMNSCAGAADFPEMRHPTSLLPYIPQNNELDRCDHVHRSFLVTSLFV